MANIKQLLISGIRSFGPDEHDKQLIVFKRPLTLILGENGCGKTTIIESLKYALCGELPPNCNKGQSFVHDPKVNKSREVLGQIRLQFVSPNDTRYLIVRSMQAQIKQKTMQFKSIDSTIQIIDDPTNPIEISGRCGQTDATIASILGVSKAILNNVIFCHQEDSNWPLEEGKKLKERFDAIFDATKYNKCFESIRKMTKQYKLEIIQLELSVKYALERKQDFDAKKVKIVTEEDKIRDAVTKQEELVQRLVPLRQRLSEIDEIEKNIMTYISKKEHAKARLENIIRQQLELKQTIKTFYIGTDDDLKTEIDTFVSNLRDKENQIEDCMRKLNSLKNQDAETAKKISSLEIKKSELFTLEGQHQEKISARNSQLMRAAEYAELEISGDIEDEDEAGRVMDRIEKKRKALAKELKDYREKCEADVKDLQKNVDSCRDASARHKQKIICRKQETQDLAKKVDKLKSEIKVANQSKNKLDAIQADLAVAERNLESISDECDVAALQDSINTDDAIITQFEKDLEELNQMITKMQAQHAKQTAINLQKEDLGRKEKTATRYKNKNRDVMIAVLGRLPDKRYKETFYNCQKQLKNEVDQLNKNLKLKQHEITSLESKRTHQKEELKKKKNEITAAEEQLYNYCGKLTLEEKLSKIDADINFLQDQKMGVSSFEFVIGKFVEKLKEESPCCPLCHRGFESQQEIADLISELEDKVRDVPKNLDSVLNNLSRQAATRDQLVSMRPLDKKVRSLKNEEIPALEKALDKTERDIQEAHDGVDELQMSLSEPERKLDAVASMLPDMSLLDQAVQEIVALTAEIAKLESQIDTSEFTMNQDEAVAKQKETRQETNRLRAMIKSNQTKLNKHNQKLQQAMDKKNQLTGESLKIQAKIQELCSLQAQLDACEKEKEKGELDLRMLMESSNVLQTQLDGAETKKKALVDQNRIQDDKQQKQVVEFDKMWNVIAGYNKEINTHKAKNISGQLEKLKRPLLELHEKKEQLSGELQSQASIIDSIKDDISNHQVNKRDLDDNLSLRNHQQEQRLKEQEIRAVDEKVGEMNYRSLSVEKEKLFQTQDEISQKKAETVGIIKKLQEFVKEAKAELKQPKFKDVHEEYKKKLYEMILLKAADRDLRDYSMAMDLCLMQFHKEKMTKINNIIRDMWRNIYRGNDIDYIEIKTDENADSASSGTKRVYNYRVVQKRNDTEIDMRGRCSAGQKVLACLIIRMALAETFSNRFGVLALDEPTTNLDKENVTSLCNALGDMVLTRMNQNNFMFIIITHDAEFLTALGRIDKLTHYYKMALQDSILDNRFETILKQAVVLESKKADNLKTG